MCLELQEEHAPSLMHWLFKWTHRVPEYLYRHFVSQKGWITVPAKYSALAFFFRTSKPVVCRQEYLPEVERLLSSWKSYGFQGTDSYSSYPVSRKRAEWQNAHFEWKQKKRYHFPSTGSNMMFENGGKIEGNWGRGGKCFKNTATKQTEIVQLQNESSTFFFSPRKWYYIRGATWKRWRRQTFSWAFKHNQGLLKINYSPMNFSMIHLSFIEEFYFQDSDYIVKLRCHTFSNGQSVILDSKSIAIYLCCLCKSSHVEPPFGVTKIAALKI